MASFAEVVAVERLNSNTYTGHFEDAWCIGSGEALF